MAGRDGRETRARTHKTPPSLNLETKCRKKANNKGRVKGRWSVEKC
jgi:hypothetical protein